MSSACLYLLESITIATTSTIDEALTFAGSCVIEPAWKVGFTKAWLCWETAWTFSITLRHCATIK